MTSNTGSYAETEFTKSPVTLVPTLQLDYKPTRKASGYTNLQPAALAPALRLRLQNY